MVMMERIKKIQGKKKIMENLSYLSAIQIMTLLFPLVTIPYLIQILGSEYYGKVIYAQTIASYFSLLVNYGFHASGVKEISLHRNDKEKVNEIFSSIMIVKISLFTLSFGLLGLVCFLLNISTQDTLLYLFSFFICLNDLLFPQWFFQGIEKLKYSTLTNVLIKVIFLILVFVVVKSPSDFLYVPLLNAFGAIIGGGMSLFFVFYKEKVTFIFPQKRTIFAYLRESTPLFASDFVFAVKDRFNVIFIGMFLGMHGVTIYDVGYKLLSIMLLPSTIINQAVYPQMAIKKSKKALQNIILLSVALYFVLTCIVQLILPFALTSLFKVGEEAILPVRVLLCAPIIYSVSFSLSRNGLIVCGKYKLLFVGMLYATLFYLLCIVLGYLVDNVTSVMFFVCVTLLVYLFELVYRWIVCRKEGII